MKIKKNNKGSTMVEVLVAFTLIMFMSVSFYHIVKISDTFLKDSKDNIARNEELNEKICLDESDDTQFSGTLSLVIDKKKTNAVNNAAEVNLILPNTGISKYTDSEGKMTIYRIYAK